jgi:hypothetical protein
VTATEVQKSRSAPSLDKVYNKLREFVREAKAELDSLPSFADSPGWASREEVERQRSDLLERLREREELLASFIAGQDELGYHPAVDSAWVDDAA